MAALLAISVSASLARRRLRPNQAKLRSTTQRLGRRTKPRARSERLTIGQLEPLVAGRGGRDLALIAAVGEDQAEKGEAAADAREQRGQPVAVLDAGGMNDAAQQQAQRVDQDVALAAVDLLAGIVAARAAAFAGLDRLAVDDAGGRLRLAARRPARARTSSA